MYYFAHNGIQHDNITEGAFHILSTELLAAAAAGAVIAAIVFIIRQANRRRGEITVRIKDKEQ